MTYAQFRQGLIVEIMRDHITPLAVAQRLREQAATYREIDWLEIGKLERLGMFWNGQDRGYIDVDAMNVPGSSARIVEEQQLSLPAAGADDLDFQARECPRAPEIPEEAA